MFWFSSSVGSVPACECWSALLAHGNDWNDSDFWLGACWISSYHFLKYFSKCEFFFWTFNILTFCLNAFDQDVRHVVLLSLAFLLLSCYNILVIVHFSLPQVSALKGGPCFFDGPYLFLPVYFKSDFLSVEKVKLRTIYHVR